MVFFWLFPCRPSASTLIGHPFFKQVCKIPDLSWNDLSSLVQQSLPMYFRMDINVSVIKSRNCHTTKLTRIPSCTDCLKTLLTQHSYFHTQRKYKSYLIVGQQYIEKLIFKRLSLCFFSCSQIKRRPSEALPELLRPVSPITSYESSHLQDSPSGLASLESGLSHLEVDDWDFWQWSIRWEETCRILMGTSLRIQGEIFL